MEGACILCGAQYASMSFAGTASQVGPHHPRSFTQGEFSLTQATFHQHRITVAHNRYLSAIRTLAQVRRLQVPAMQVNIAEQQLNVAGIASAQLGVSSE